MYRCAYQVCITVTKVHQLKPLGFHTWCLSRKLCELFEIMLPLKNNVDILQTSHLSWSQDIHQPGSGASKARDMKKREETIMYQMLGNIDEIHRRKTPLKMSDIGWITVYDSEEKKEARRPSREILIEGAPGVGKTTLAWHLCQKLEKGELLEQWSVVVMLQLRDKRI